MNVQSEQQHPFGQQNKKYQYDISSGRYAWLDHGLGMPDNHALHTTLAYTPYGAPWVAFNDKNNGNKLSYLTLNGGIWSMTDFPASAGDQAGLAFSPDLNGYFVYRDTGDGNKAKALSKNPRPGWIETVSTGATDVISLAISPSSVPFVSYQEAAKRVVRKFDGASWVTSGEFDQASYLSMAFAPDGRLFLAYRDDSNNGNLTVVKPAEQSSIVVSSTANPYYKGDGSGLYFTAAVSCAGNPATKGTLALKEGTAILGSFELSEVNNSYTFNISSLSVGKHEITAVFSGNEECSVAKSDVLNQVVQVRTGQISIYSSANPYYKGGVDSLKLSANVSCSGNPATKGTITFKEGAATLGSLELSEIINITPVDISSLSVGKHEITAVFSGSEDCTAATSDVLNQDVQLSPSLTSISASANPAYAGVPNVITASASCRSQTLLTGGTIMFKEGTTILGSSSFNNFPQSPATFDTSNLSVGTHNITAVFDGSATCGPSTSPVLAQVITAATLPLNITITGSGNVHGHDQSQAVGVPSDIACSRNTGVCSAQYPVGDTIILTSTPEGATSVFEKWGGACSGTTTPCSVHMNGVQNVSANFIQAQLAKNFTTGLFYPTLSEALAAANAVTPDVVLLLGTDYVGAVTLTRGITIKGGWDALYQSQSGLPTTLNSGLTVQSGASLLESLVIKGTLSITKGTLRANGVTVR